MTNLRDKIAYVVSDAINNPSLMDEDKAADAILALPEIADLQAKLVEVEAERDEWKGVYQQADRHHMEAERSTKTAEAAIPRAYQMGLDAAFTEMKTFAPHEEYNTGPEHDIGFASGYHTAMNRTRALQPPADLVVRAKGGE